MLVGDSYRRRPSACPRPVSGTREWGRPAEALAERDRRAVLGDDPQPEDPASPGSFRPSTQKRHDAGSGFPVRECPLPSRWTLIRQVPHLAGASLGTHGRTDVRADRPDGASSCEISSAIGEHRQVATEVRLTSEPAANQCVPPGAESGALVVRRIRSRGRRSAAAGRRARGQEG
jgi:hypothetical protein